MMKNVLVYRFDGLSCDPFEYKPFSRKNFKELHTAVAIAHGDAMYEAVESFLQSCVVDESSMRVGDLPYWDAAMLFVKARAVSVSEMVELRYTCRNIVHDNSTNTNKPCGTSIPAGLLLNNVHYINVTGANTNLKMTNTLHFVMRFPTLKEYLQLTYEGDSLEVKDDILSKLIIGVYNDEVYDGVDINKNFNNEVKEILSELPPRLFNKLGEWLNDLPNISVRVNIKCHSCGAVDVDDVVGIVDFFG